MCHGTKCIDCEIGFHMNILELITISSGIFLKTIYLKIKLTSKLHLKQRGLGVNINFHLISGQKNKQLSEVFLTYQLG